MCCPVFQILIPFLDNEQSLHLAKSITRLNNKIGEKTKLKLARGAENWNEVLTFWASHSQSFARVFLTCVTDFTEKETLLFVDPMSYQNMSFFTPIFRPVSKRFT